MGFTRLEKFLHGCAAASELYSNAAKNGYFVEAICLAANLIDAQLRIGIILARQIQRKDRSIDAELLFQSDSDRPIFEREVYSIAERESVISVEFATELRNLYNDRNRVVHRYIITDITTEQVLDIGIADEKALEKVRSAIWKLERMQIQLGVGMTVEGPEFEGTDAEK